MPANRPDAPPRLLSIVELGGYPDFSSLYRELGFEAVVMSSMRKALKYIKSNPVSVIVAEFNFQSDFRDRTSQLESLMASIAQMPQVRVIVFYDQEQRDQLKRVTQRFEIHATMAYPIDEQGLKRALLQPAHGR